MSNLRAAAQQALEQPEQETRNVRTSGALCPEQVRAQPEQEPVAFLLEYKNGERELRFKNIGWPAKETPLYTHPPRREWRGLTEEEREQATGWSVEHIEAALKERNA